MFSKLNDSFFSRLLKKSDFKYHSIEQLIGFRPRNLKLYQTALMHKSLAGEKKSNERLEYLGDAALNLIISQYLYNKFKGVSEGELSQMRAKLVNRVLLNKIAVKLNINELLKTQIGSKDQPRFIYGNALEAVIGAIYIDKGLEKAADFVLRRVYQLDKSGEIFLQEEVDFKSRALEWAMKQNQELKFSSSKVVKDNELTYIAKIKLNGKIISKGEGLTKKQAEQNASKHFFNQLEK